MNQPTLGAFLFSCLSRAGIFNVFGVPGDYNFSILDELGRHPELSFIGCRNELNAGYAADAFARLKGISALLTTFGVGELSACNAIAGSNSESVPVVHIVGAPPSMDQSAHKLMHHSLMDGNFDTFRKVYESLTAYAAAITLENASYEIPKALHMAQTQKKPVYLTLPNDLITKPIHAHAESWPAPATTASSLAEAAAHAGRLLKGSSRTVLLTDVKVLRYGLENAVRLLAEKLHLPAASMVYGKGSFDETHPNYIGMYSAGCGEESVRRAVENADCVIAVGLVWADTNTASFTAKLDFAKTIQINPDNVRIGEAMYAGIQAPDMMDALMQLQIVQAAPVPAAAFPYDLPQGQPDDDLAAANYYPLFQQFIQEGDVVVVETGTLFDGMSQLKLPRNVTYVAQGGWQAIGYATPAAFGACIAAPDRRVLLFTGDGSIHLTAQEISSMLEHQCKPILFILNNGLYVVENYLNVDAVNPGYNVIPKWDFSKLPEAFGGDAFTATARTVAELRDAMRQAAAECRSRLCMIELIPGNPMDAPPFLVKSRAILEAQKKNR
ncbi:alpha-keto acid decarboxylase family protein [Paenibacillus humicus]|uniref:alpha-keto acid decarboxylase family protein n=1 Tax=Paenibacillus humicus TaxID=412861 RepID=UPI003F14AC36